jgi:hypothetical protein
VREDAEEGAREAARRYMGAKRPEPTERSTIGPAWWSAYMLKPRWSAEECRKHAVTRVSKWCSQMVDAP